MSEWKDGFASGYEAGLRNATGSSAEPLMPSRGFPSRSKKPAKKPRKALPSDGYHAKYGRAFKRLAPKYKKKGGGWKKNGFKRCAAAARKVAKK